MRRVLVLRPEPGATATVERARQLGVDARAVPLFEIEAVNWETPEAGSFDGLLLTSANAVRHGGESLRALRALKVYAVGSATAEAAREAGFDIAGTGEAGVERLLGSLEPGLRLLHLCGEDRMRVDGAAQEVVQVVVYRSTAVANPHLGCTDEALALIHSARAAERFGELVEDRSSIVIAAISPAAAAAAGTGWEAVASAPEPTDEALLALAAGLCNNSAPK